MICSRSSDARHNSQMGEALMHALADPFKLWTFEELDKLPDEEFKQRRLEILDGLLIMSPQLSFPHGRMASLLTRAVDAAGHSAHLVLTQIGVAIESSYLVPDLMVVRA